MATMNGPTTPKQAARKLWEMGANITSIPADGKEPAHEWNNRKAPWATERQDLDIVNSLPWNIERKVWRGRVDPPIVTIGVISGINGWRCLDIDSCKDEHDNKTPVPENVAHAVLVALGLTPDYPWYGRSRSGAGWHIWFLCGGELPPELAAATSGKESGIKTGTPLAAYAGMFDHIELRWERCQTVLPAPTGYNGHLPEEPPALVGVDQAAAAFGAIATPKAPEEKARPQQQRSSSSTEHGNVIGAFNRRYDVEHILFRNGYQERGGAWQHPNTSDPMTYGVNILDGKAYTHHATDPLNTGRAHDAFSAYCILEHRDDMRAAIKAAAADLGITPRTATRQAASAGAPEQAPEDARASIQVNDLDIPHVARQAWNALMEQQEGNPTLFRRGGALVHIGYDDDGRRVVQASEYAHMRGLLARSCVFWRERQTKTGSESVVVAPPEAVVSDALVYHDERVPVLRRVVHTPVFDPTGNLLATSGYHPSGRIYYDPTGAIPAMPEHAPTPEEIDQARALIMDELLADFPFVDQADKAHAVALLLLPFVRSMIPGPTPLHLIEAPTMGSGKGLLADVLTTISTGAPPAPMTEARDDDEWRKRLTSTLLGAPSHVLLDNINRTLDSGSLAAALTASEWQDRLLGVSANVRLPVQVVWLATANNPTMSSEIARRTVRIRIDPRRDRPWLRTGFKHENLRLWARENRGRLVQACITLIRAGLPTGTPGPTLGTFEDWAGVMGRILSGVGIPGFLENLIKLYDAADTEGQRWRAVVGVWREAYDSQRVKAADVYRVVSEAGIDMELRGKTEKAMQSAFGKALAKMKDRVIAGYQIVHAGNHKRVAEWRLISTDGSEDPPKTEDMFEGEQNTTTEENTDGVGGVGSVGSGTQSRAPDASARAHNNTTRPENLHQPTPTYTTPDKAAEEQPHISDDSPPEDELPPDIDAAYVRRLVVNGQLGDARTHCAMRGHTLDAICRVLGVELPQEVQQE